MGVFGSGGGTLGLGGTKWDPNTWGNLDLDLGLHPSGITIEDATINWPDPRPYQPGGVSLPDDPIGDISDTLGDIFGDDPMGDLQEDAENWWDENTDSFNDLESGINTTFDDAVDLGETGIENLAILGGGLEDTAGLLGEGVTWATGATLDINNPNSLISSPQNWYEEWGLVSNWNLGDADPAGLGDQNAAYLEWGLDAAFGGYGSGGDDGGGSAQTGSGSNLGPEYASFEGLQGDPFGREGKERREIHMQRKFPQQVATAPSLVNQTRKLG